ncbi:hypothetical protein BXZ70DRAFT_273821 [Cristinia sonorae]|uniref:Uncharacterized protein n=1 Tax=Cristinia sonorae TaxID=1940300 RepID=A0A8K0XUI7_9AGAR|nr:hypothetical protein BXZ70DRAFT_273821 [Cristinia sonorae]
MLASRIRFLRAHTPHTRSLCPRVRHYSVPVKRSDLPPAFSAKRYAGHAEFALDFFRRFIKFTAIGVVGVAFTTFTLWEGAHMYVENVELVPDIDPEVHKWEWDLEEERWGRGPSGGTDSGLGVKGSHAVRSAWMAQNWGVGTASKAPSPGMSGRHPGSGTGPGGLSVVEARLEIAQAFLAVALQIAASRTEKLRPHTLVELQQRHANILERMGTRETLHEARRVLERVWASLPGQGIEAARTALKLGDINRRLGDDEDALDWWARALQLVQEQNSRVPVTAPPTTPASVPSSPLAQRTLISTLVSLSAFYATARQLPQAQSLEESALALLRSIRQPDSLETAPPPQALHALYILHRSSLLSIHLAEVLYAQRNGTQASLEWLARAAESSERVALVLSGQPLIHPDAPQSKIPHPPSSETALLPLYAKSRAMHKPAASLLRDARRTAAEAWNLMGILTEDSKAPGSQKQAFECYERALGWAGVSGDRAGAVGKAGEGTLEADWKLLWNNYVRARNALKKEEK